MNVTKSGNQIGSKVTPDTPAPYPSHVSIDGRYITLEPLSTSHADDLFDCLSGEARAPLWDYMSYGPFEDRKDRKVFDDLILKQSQSRDPLFFAAREKKTGKAVGYMGLMRIDTTNRALEIGHIMYSPLLQRTAAATECMYLMARHVFDTLGYRRYEWKCNNLNAASRKAASRLGFTFEGVFRQHMIVKGRSRDTAWFSMLDSEWPEMKRVFEAWLDPKNFDAEGNQLVSLVSLREFMRGEALGRN